jgi:hypothetical protein
LFDNFAIVKLIEMQNEIDRARWRKDEDAFYRDLAGGDEARFSSVWKRFRGLISPKRETTGEIFAGPSRMLAARFVIRQRDSSGGPLRSRS